MSAHPLAGVRVVELASNVAGPFAAVILADLGADVVKVEARSRGDDARRMAPVLGPTSAFYGVLNRNKSAVALDLRDPIDRQNLDMLLADADVVVTSLLPRVQAELALDAAALAQDYPRLIHASISAYGADGAERDRPGYDSVLQARSGVMAVTGDVGAPDVRVGVSILDMGSGVWLALAVVAALRERERTGTGGSVATSLLEVGSSLMSYHVAAHQLSGQNEFRSGSEHPAFSPYGVYRTGDGRLAIGVGGDAIFLRLIGALGRPAGLMDERFSTNSQRVTYRDELRLVIEDVLASGTTEHWLARLVDAMVPADAVTGIAAILDDPQLMANDIWLQVPVDSETTIRVPGLPIRFDAARPRLRLPPPSALELQ